ncbi:MAG: DEAD/DEAH box helicase, partial [Chloroflexi bacterium]|nr:DEAD/DEAH box helicase [Chloroflexota bacterium]
MSNEADTCRRYVVPRLIAAGWDNDPHSIAEQHAFTAGRIMVSGMPGATPTRLEGKRADYLLRYTRDFALAVVEAKAEHKTPGAGLQQAKDYAEILGL